MCQIIEPAQIKIIMYKYTKDNLNIAISFRI